MGKPFILVNLNKQADEALVEHGPVGLMELLLKRASRANFLAWMREHKQLVRSLPAGRYLRQGIVYVLEVGKGEADAIIETFVSVYPELKETIMTAARQLERRGEERGMQQGMQQGLERTAKNMLRKGYDYSAVKELTGLSDEELKKLQ
jgi:predicted transposase/invertase (TIGR01784 family)